MNTSSALSVIQKEARVVCQLTEEGGFEPYLFASKDAVEIAKAFGDGCEARPIPNALALGFADWFDYRYKDVENPFDPDGVWLTPNRHAACRDIETLLTELQVTADKWQKIQLILNDPADTKARSISGAMGEDLKRELSSLVSGLQRFMNYEVVEV